MARFWPKVQTAEMVDGAKQIWRSVLITLGLPRAWAKRVVAADEDLGPVPWIDAKDSGA
jgi:hypothetical protein